MPEDGLGELGVLVVHEFLRALLLLVGHVPVEVLASTPELTGSEPIAV